MERNARPYKAMIWTPDQQVPGKEVEIVADSLDDAKEKLEAEYGKGNVYYLRNEEDAAKPR